MINVLMDFEIEKGMPLENMGFPESILNGLNLLKKEIYDRVKILEGEAAEQPNGRVVIRLAPPKILYEYYGELGAKMQDCISESDYRYYISKIDSFFPPMA